MIEAFLARLAIGAAVSASRRIIPALIVVAVFLALAIPITILILLSAPTAQPAPTAATGLCATRVDAAPEDETGHTKTTADLRDGWQPYAATITAAALARFPGADGGQAAVIALATAMQESRLANLPGGDRDSVGLFQQRAGWGTFAQRTDPTYAVGRFLDALAAVPGWQTMPVTVAAQRVQRSGFPDAYAAWEALARSLAGTAGQPCTPAAVAGSCPVTDVSGYGNGLLPVADLCPLASAPGQVLRGDAANAFEALNEDYRAHFGVSITVTDSYRDLASQYDVYARKPTLAAKPGTSNHGLGVAVDLGGGIQNAISAEHAWMSANAPRYGWINPTWAQKRTGKFEPWHWEHQG